MSFPRYPEYKDSGVEWLEEVPAHWDVVRIKHLVQSIEQGWSPQCESFPVENEEEWGVLKVGCVNGGSFNPTENKKLPAELKPEPALGILDGDLLISRANTRELVGSTAVADKSYPNLLLCDKLYRLRLNASCESKFLARYLLTDMARGQIEISATGASSSMLNIGQSTILEMPLALPSKNEREVISDFLDLETAKIDTLIAEQEQLIALLKEKRQAVISHAVTKGLDPNVKMKDSGIEWLGEVPGHWDNVALKRISPSLTVGIVVNPSNYVVEEGLPFIYGGDIREGQITFETARCISQEDSLRNEKTRLMAGDLLTVRVGYPGITAVVPPECEGGNCASVMHVRRGNFDSRWLCYVMNSRIVRFQVEVVQYGAAQEQFNISHAVEFRVPRPPANEQREIADFLDHQSGQFDELIAEALQGISLLKERRSALISAAVTGKVDVRTFNESPNANLK